MPYLACACQALTRQRVHACPVPRLVTWLQAKPRVRPLLPGERDAGERAAPLRVIVVHVPRPAVRRSIVDEGGVEPTGRRLGEHEWDRVRHRGPTPHPGRIERIVV